MMDASTDNAASETDRYHNWCDHIQRVLSHPHTSVFDRVSESDSYSRLPVPGDVEKGNEKEEDEYPWCFFSRMMSRVNDSPVFDEDEPAYNHMLADSCSVDAEDFSSISQRHYVPLRNEDEGMEILSKKIKEKQSIQGRSTRPQEPLRYGTAFCGDAKVERLYAQFNEELSEILSFVRERNALSEQLRSQLVRAQSVKVLLASSPAVD